ncbi:MAG: 3-hydroxyacyl-ACP dehydratase FabZ [Robiginitomaculum sp.]
MMKYKFPMDVGAIMEYLPHRAPMLMLDRVIGVYDGEIEAEKLVLENAFYFQGHFPNKPIMPGVMIVEAIAQVGALLASLEEGFDSDTNLLAFASIEKVKFRQLVYPNETLRVFAKIVKKRRNLYKFEGRALMGDSLVTQISFAATLVPRK